MSIGQDTRVGRLRIRVDRLVYTTITLMSVLIIYDGWNHLSFWGVLAVILGPMLAIFLSHLFGAELGPEWRWVARSLGVSVGRRSSRSVVFWSSSPRRFLILIVLSVAGVSYGRIVQVIVLAGVASLGVWGGVAGRRAGLTGWGLVASTAYGLLWAAAFWRSRRCFNRGRNPFSDDRNGHAHGGQHSGTPARDLVLLSLARLDGAS